jgi:DNA-binding MarR family transcriptional regulator
MDKIAVLDGAISSLMRTLIIQERQLSSHSPVVPNNPLDLETLIFLNQHPGCSAKDIAAYLQVSATTLQSVIDRLEKSRLLAKDNTALRGRAVALFLTQEGSKARTLIQTQNMTNCKMMLDVIDPQDQDKFIDQIVKIARKFSEPV